MDLCAAAVAHQGVELGDVHGVAGQRQAQGGGDLLVPLALQLVLRQACCWCC